GLDDPAAALPAEPPPGERVGDRPVGDARRTGHGTARTAHRPVVRPVRRAGADGAGLDRDRAVARRLRPGVDDDAVLAGPRAARAVDAVVGHGVHPSLRARAGRAAAAAVLARQFTAGDAAASRRGVRYGA